MWAVWHGTSYLQAPPDAMYMHEAFASRNYTCALNACMKHLHAGTAHVHCEHSWSAAQLDLCMNTLCMQGEKLKKKEKTI